MSRKAEYTIVLTYRGLGLRDALMKVPIGLRAGVERLGPLAAGLVAGVIGLLVAPSRAGDGFFAAAAQVLPLLLLALVLEAGIFGGPVGRQPEPGGRVVALGYARKALELLTVAALVVGEWQAVHLLADGQETGDARLAYMAIAWGLLTIALLAVFGARPRTTVSVDWRPGPGPRWIVALGMANVYGDKEVEPIMNCLVPSGHQFYECDHAGEPLAPAGQRAPSLLVTKEVVDGEEVEFRYVGRRVRLTPGDAAVVYYSVGLRGAGSAWHRVPAILRLDHAEISNGRTEVLAWLDREKPGRVASSP